MACRSEIVSAKAASESEYFDWMRGIGGVGVGVVKARWVGQPNSHSSKAGSARADSTRTERQPMSTKTSNTQPPMPGSELFIQNADGSPAYWRLGDLGIVLAWSRRDDSRLRWLEFGRHGQAAHPENGCVR